MRTSVLPGPTIRDAIEGFETWLNVYVSEEKLKENVEVETLKELIAALKEWQAHLPKFVDFRELAMKEALHRIGILKEASE